MEAGTCFSSEHDTKCIKMQCFVWCGLILAEKVIWLSLQIPASCGNTEAKQSHSQNDHSGNYRRKVLQGLFPIPLISLLPVKSIWNPHEEALVIYSQQQNAMGSLHNIDFGVFWASWGGSGKEPGSGNRFREVVPGTIGWVPTGQVFVPEVWTEPVLGTGNQRY